MHLNKVILKLLIWEETKANIIIIDSNPIFYFISYLGMMLPYSIPQLHGSDISDTAANSYSLPDLANLL